MDQQTNKRLTEKPTDNRYNNNNCIYLKRTFVLRNRYLDHWQNRTLLSRLRLRYVLFCLSSMVQFSQILPHFIFHCCSVRPFRFFSFFLFNNNKWPYFCSNCIPLMNGDGKQTSLTFDYLSKANAPYANVAIIQFNQLLFINA